MINEDLTDNILNNMEVRFVFAIDYTKGSIILNSNEPFSNIVLEDYFHFYRYYFGNQSVEALIFRVSSPNVIFLVSTKC